MQSYQIKTVIHKEKLDEFVRNLRSLWFEFLKEDGCKGYRVYQEFEKEQNFCLVGEFETQDAMEKHFQGENFEVLIGSTGVLGNSFKLAISVVCEEGGRELAKSKLKKDLIKRDAI